LPTFIFRPNLEELQKELSDLGATHVVTEQFCRTPEMTQLMKVIIINTLNYMSVSKLFARKKKETDQLIH
jgi:hypothetical protein